MQTDSLLDYLTNEMCLDEVVAWAKYLGTLEMLEPRSTIPLSPHRCVSVDYYCFRFKLLRLSWIRNDLKRLSIVGLLVKSIL